MMRNRLFTYTVAILFLPMFFVVQKTHAQGLSNGSEMPLSDSPLQDVRGKTVTLGDLTGTKGTVVVFWTNDCVWATRAEDRIVSMASEFTPRGVAFVLVNSNDAVAFPKESAAEGQKKGFSFPYLIDSESALAEAFGAMRTPHVFVFDGNRTMVYKGAIDDSPGDPSNVKTNYLEDALNALVAGQEVSIPQSESFGCNIKFKGR